MNLSKSTTLAAAAFAVGLTLLPASHASAQDAAATPAVSASAPPPPPNGERPPGNRDDFRQRMAERIKTQLKASDDEWTVIQPLLEKVSEKLLATRSGGGFGGPGGPGGNREGGRRGGDNAGGNQPAANADNNNQQGGGNRGPRREGGPRGGSPETQALAASLADDNSTVNDVKAKLQAVRDQRKQAATELAQSREDLRKVLNMRQEAALVMDGILD